jgi:1-acyl-sn-glycerol-3-phosphate acyltransferase
LLYNILKPLVRLAMLIFCRRVIINKPEILKRKGPLLLACNHPNSFLDATILAELFKEPSIPLPGVMSLKHLSLEKFCKL